MTARLLLILGALACADPPDPQDAARPAEAHRLLQRGTLFLQQDRPARALADTRASRGARFFVEHRPFSAGASPRPARPARARHRRLQTRLGPDARPAARSLCPRRGAARPAPLPRGSYLSGAGYRPSARARQISLLSRRGAPCHRRFCGRARSLQTHHRTRARPS